MEQFHRVGTSTINVHLSWKRCTRACIAAYSRVGTTQNLLVLEQLVGFLHAHEELVLRTRMRCPAKLFAQTRYQPPQYQPQQCLIDRKSTRLNSSHLGISYAVF